ncbi:minor capsid protein [Gudongella oleilytica]|uniref:minor capsid protein n=1 Tax=Gudongella oleilytica TaxID=1582259 RepID=UPI002A36ED4C|nr:minor capsid protein [Gudongella oleilytica]MDY0256243.1 minor capsid protein [Gudongella oleilytica]
MSNSKIYWYKRALVRENEAYLRGAALSAKTFTEYEKAAKAIRKEISDFYSRYAGKYGLPYEQAVRLLNKREAQEWKASLAEYVRKIAQETDPRVKALLTAQLDALSYNSSITRLEALIGQIDMILNDLFTKGVAQMKAEFGDNFTESYYHKVYDLQCRAGFLNEFAKINAGMIEGVVSYPWSGAMFSDRLWQNKQALLFHLREITTQGLIQGKSVVTMSKEMSARMGQSYKNAERLIRTETNHIHNEAEIAAYKAAGVKEYEFVATLDSRTSEICASLDGKHFPLSEARPGTNFPPMHPNCRSATVEYDPDDEMDWYNSGKKMPKNMTYSEWAEYHGIKQKKSSASKRNQLQTVD